MAPRASASFPSIKDKAIFFSLSLVSFLFQSFNLIKNLIKFFILLSPVPLVVKQLMNEIQSYNIFAGCSFINILIDFVKVLV